MPRMRDSSGPSQVSTPAASASSDTSGHGSPRALCRKAIRARRTRPPPSRAAPRPPRRAGRRGPRRHQRGGRRRDPLGGELDRTEPGAAPGDDPAVGPGDALVLVPQGGRRLQRQVLRQRGRGPDRRVPHAGSAVHVGDREPGLSGQRRPGRPEDGAGAGHHQVGRRPGTQPGDPAGVGERDDEPDRHVVGQPALAVVGPDVPGQRGLQLPHHRRPGRGGRPAAAQRAQRGDQVAVGGADVLGEQRDHLRGPPRADHRRPVEQRPGQPGVGGHPARCRGLGR